jgi:hypothetical protein
MKIIIDTPIDVSAKLPALKAAAGGDLEVGRYLDCLNPHEQKVIKPAEARAFAAAGVPLFLIYEITGRPTGAVIGRRDGAWCKDYVPTLGMPLESTIFYTVDYDAPPVDMPGILAAFRAFGTASGYRIGGYGSGSVTGRLYDEKAIALRWLSCSGAFLGTGTAKAAGNFELLQSLSKPIAGVDVDVNRLREPSIDFGARVPFGAAPPIAPAIAAAAPVSHETFLQRLAEIFRG